MHRIQELMNNARQSLAEGQTALRELETSQRAGTLTDARRQELLDTHDRAANAAQSFKREADALKRSTDMANDFQALEDTVDIRRPSGASGQEQAEPDAEPQVETRGRRGEELPDPSVTARARQAWPKEARAAFVKYLRTRNLSDTEMRALTPYVNPDGGYAVVHELRQQYILQERNLVQIMKYATVLETEAASVSFPTFKAKIPTSKVRANQKVATKSLRDILGRTTFNPNEQAVIIKVPQQLVEDSNFALINFLGKEIASDAAETQEEQFLNGTGANEPLGILQSPILTDTLTSGATLTPEKIIGLPYELRAAFRQGAVWMFNRRGIQSVRRMRDDSGATPGTGQFLWQIGLQAGEPDRLCGYPVLESEFFPNAFTGSAGDPVALFGDWSNYWIVRRLALAVERLGELYAETSEVGFKYRMRYDAAPVRMEAFVRLNRA
jgi:HK97 family phage major capsid protein